MKKYLVLIICIFAFLPIFVMADKNFNDAKEEANNYIYSLPEYSRYLKTNGDQSFGFDGKKVTTVNGFKTGGFLSVAEYERSKNGNTSYLAPGIQYWLIDGQALDLVPRSGVTTSGVRVTEYVLHDTRVTGAGTQTTPWEFVDGYKVKIGTTDRTKGTISESYDHVYANSDSAYDFTLKLTGKYDLNADECIRNKNGKFEKISETESEVKYKVTKVIGDFICNINLGASCNKVNFTNGENGSGGMDGKSLYYKYGNGWYSDPNCSKVVNSSDISAPTSSGYAFLGYIVDDKTIISKDLDLYSNIKDSSITDNIEAIAKWKKTEITSEAIAMNHRCQNEDFLQPGEEYVFTYTGACKVVQETTKNWKVYLYGDFNSRSGTHVLYFTNNMNLDLFLVGGGGAAGAKWGGGGGGGYTKTYFGINMNGQNEYNVHVGKGGSTGCSTANTHYCTNGATGAGERTWVIDNSTYFANGGNGGNCGGAGRGLYFGSGGGTCIRNSVDEVFGGSGGSGGGSGWTDWYCANNHNLGSGGTYKGTNNGRTKKANRSTGQGYSTCEFASDTTPAGTTCSTVLYATGGDGGCCVDNDPWTCSRSGKGTANTGNGGNADVWNSNAVHAGGSGIVVFRNKR